jgi:hypothetical protein
MKPRVCAASLPSCMDIGLVLTRLEEQRLRKPVHTVSSGIERRTAQQDVELFPHLTCTDRVYQLQRGLRLGHIRHLMPFKGLVRRRPIKWDPSTSVFMRDPTEHHMGFLLP